MLANGKYSLYTIQINLREEKNTLSDILLLHPSEQGKTFGSMPPLGMAWITSFLQSQEISTTLIDLQVTYATIESLLQKYHPMVVGIGGTSHTRFESFSIARKVKSYDSKIQVLYGGSHATFTADDTLSHIPEIDFIVRGEGEQQPIKSLFRFYLERMISRISVV